MIENIRILTPRLEIRAPRLEDAEKITAAKQEIWDELQEWMSWAYDDEKSLEATKEYIVRRTTDLKDGNLPLIGLCRETGKFVVSTGLNIHKGVTAETGYWVAKEFQGKGYATEATNAAIRYGFHALGLKDVTAGYYDDNEKSRHVLEKLGFTKTDFLEMVWPRCSDMSLMDKHCYEMTDPSVLPPLEVSWK